MVIIVESKYLTIYSNLVAAIEAKEYKANDKLPSESELMAAYQVSRDTIRKSLQMLEQNGYIQKSRGKEATVLDVSKFDFLVSGVTSFKELAPMLGHDIKTMVILLEESSSDHKMQALMQASSETPICKVERVRQVDHEKIIYDIDYFNAELVPGITKEIAEDSLYEYIEQKLGLKIGFAKKEITVQPATEKDRKYLHLKQFDVVVSVKSLTYLENATVFQFTESRHRPDKFKFVDFARRMK